MRTAILALATALVSASCSWVSFASDDRGRDGWIALGTDGTIHLVYRESEIGEVRHAFRSLANGLDDDCDGTAL